MFHRLSVLRFLLLWPLLGASCAPALLAQNAEPEVYIPRQRLDALDMLGQDAPQPKVEVVQEAATATEIRTRGGGLEASISAEMIIPRSLTWQELAAREPSLARHAPWLPQHPGTVSEKVSPLFHAFYRAHWEDANQRMLSGSPPVPAKGAYDLVGAWEMPATAERPAMLMLRARFTLRPETSPADFLTAPIGDPTAVPYEPRTVYRWPGGSATAAADQLKATLRIQTELEREYAIRGLPRARNRALEAGLAQRQAELADLPKWNYLDASTVPFFSLPLIFRQYPDYQYSPRPGDLAVVISGDVAAPALYGDDLAGQNHGVGQFSTALARLLETPPGSTLPATPPPLDRTKSWEATLLIFLGTAPTEPKAVATAELRDALEKLTPLSQAAQPAPPPPVAPQTASESPEL